MIYCDGFVDIDSRMDFPRISGLVRLVPVAGSNCETAAFSEPNGAADVEASFP